MAGVDLKRRWREVRLAVEPPPLLAELRERLLAGVESSELARPLASNHLRLERLGIALATEDLRPVAPTLAPAHAPDDTAVLALHALDTHGASPLSDFAASRRRKLPRSSGRGALTAGPRGRSAGLTRHSSSHSSNAARGM